MNVAILWDIAPASPYVNPRFGGTYHLNLQGQKSAEQETRVQQVAGKNSAHHYIPEDGNIQLYSPPG
jgi:hypothetical protein